MKNKKRKEKKKSLCLLTPSLSLSPLFFKRSSDLRIYIYIHVSSRWFSFVIRPLMAFVFLSRLIFVVTRFSIYTSGMCISDIGGFTLVWSSYTCSHPPVWVGFRKGNNKMIHCLLLFWFQHFLFIRAIFILTIGLLSNQTWNNFKHRPKHVSQKSS